MKIALHHRVSGRWLLPIVVSLWALIVFVQEKPSPKLFSFENGPILGLILMLGVWAGVAWWIAFDENRYIRFRRRIQPRVLLLLGFFVSASVCLLDICSSFLDDLWPVLFQHLFVLCAVLVGCFALVSIVLVSVKPYQLMQNITLGLIFTLLGLLAAELIFRYVLVDSLIPNTEHAFEAQVSLAWPHPIAREKPPGTFRIVGIADSFGRYGGHQNYHHVLEELLRQASAPTYDVVNLSVGAYELPDQLEMFKRFGPRYQPDVVLHGIFIGNDFWVPPGLPVAYHGISFRTVPGFAAWRPRNWLLRTWLNNYMIFLQDRAKQEIPPSPPEKSPEKSFDGMSPEEFLRVERQRLVICLKTIRPDDEIWGQVTDQLDQMIAESKRIGAQYVLVMHPDQFQVELSLLREIGQTYNLRAEDFDLQRPQNFLRQYCQSRSIPCLDLLPAFRAKGSQGGLYLLRNTHYNEQGNLLAAQEIARFLRENNLLR